MLAALLLIGGTACWKDIGKFLSEKIKEIDKDFDLIEDFEHGMYLKVNTKISIKNVTITSENIMWEFELSGNATIEYSFCLLKNNYL